LFGEGSLQFGQQEHAAGSLGLVKERRPGAGATRRWQRRGLASRQ
jgi:hypothetical protein